MLKLSGFHVSNYHNKVRIALLEKGIAFEEDANCRPNQGEEWVARSPMGKVPVLEVDGAPLTESAVIIEYLEDAYPQMPLLPREPFARAKVRELTTHIEWHMEITARRLYPQAFFGGTVSEETRQAVSKEMAKAVRTLKALARFAPFIAGPELTVADLAAFVHLPLVSMSTRIVLGRDALEEVPQVKDYLRMLKSRPAFAKVDADRKMASAAR